MGDVDGAGNGVGEDPGARSDGGDGGDEVEGGLAGEPTCGAGARGEGDGGLSSGGGVGEDSGARWETENPTNENARSRARLKFASFAIPTKPKDI